MHNKIKALALLLMLAAQNGTACDDLYKVTREDVDRDGNTSYTVSLTHYARHMATDTVVVRLGACFIDLMDGAPGMAQVIMDGKIITIQDAMEMAYF